MLGYLDPGSGSMVAQAVVAGLAGVAVIGKLGWRRLSAPFRRKRSRDDRSSPVEAPAGE